MNVNRIIYCVIIVGLFVSSCSPVLRLQHLLKKHPYLYETITHDSIRIENVRSTDSLFFFTKEKDTIHFEHATIYRFHDTLRLRQSCPPCTTFVQEQHYQRLKTIVEKEGYKRTLKEKLEEMIIPLVIGIIVGLILRK